MGTSTMALHLRIQRQKPDHETVRYNTSLRKALASTLAYYVAFGLKFPPTQSTLRSFLKPSFIRYMGTSLITPPPPVRPCSSPMPRDLW